MATFVNPKFGMGFQKKVRCGLFHGFVSRILDSQPAFPTPHYKAHVIYNGAVEGCRAALPNIWSIRTKLGIVDGPRGEPGTEFFTAAREMKLAEMFQVRTGGDTWYIFFPLQNEHGSFGQQPQNNPQVANVANGRVRIDTTVTEFRSALAKVQGDPSFPRRELLLTPECVQGLFWFGCGTPPAHVFLDGDMDT